MIQRQRARTQVAAQMGHSSTRMFFETYARWIQDADKGVQRQAMADAFTSIKNPEPKVGSL